MHVFNEEDHYVYKNYEHKGITKQVLWHKTSELKCVLLTIMLTCYK